MVHILLKALLAAILAGMASALAVAGLMSAAVLPSNPMLMVFIVLAVAALIGAAVVLLVVARGHNRLVLERGPEMSTLIMPAAPRVERPQLQRVK
jgi:hypothetical protein